MTATPTGSSLVLTGGEQSPTRGRARRAPVNNRLARPDVLDQTDAANPNTTAGGLRIGSAGGLRIGSAGGLRIGWAPGGLRIGPGRDASRAAPTGAARQRVGSRPGEQTRARYPLVIISNPPSSAMELAGRAHHDAPEGGSYARALEPVEHPSGCAFPATGWTSTRSSPRPEVRAAGIVVPRSVASPHA